MNATTKTVVGVDTAIEVFQLHWVDVETGEVHKKQIKRAKFLEHFANLSPCLIGMEACGGSHHWARRLIGMGHEVMLMPGPPPGPRPARRRRVPPACPRRSGTRPELALRSALHRRG